MELLNGLKKIDQVKIKFLDLGLVKEGILIKDQNFCGGYKIEYDREDGNKSYVSSKYVKIIK